MDYEDFIDYVCEDPYSYGFSDEEESPRFRKVVVLTNCRSNHLPAEVKLEGYNDGLSNDCSNNGSEISERLTDVERDESDMAEEDSGESDDDIIGTGIQSIYPKWLIEVERKRADAELTRAKAEEKRAYISAQNAETAMIQAEALKKLADAAVTQADAISRIAIALESRVQPLVDDVLAI